MPRLPWVLVALVACKAEGETSNTWKAADFVPAEGLHLEYTRAGDTDTTPLMLRVEDGWSLRMGSPWAEATEVGQFAVDTSDGIVVDDVLLLPSRLEVGATVGGVQVVAMDEYTTWYGTFPMAVTVEVANGRWAGTQVLGPGLGPIAPTVDGEAWDLVYYE